MAFIAERTEIRGGTRSVRGVPREARPGTITVHPFNDGPATWTPGERGAQRRLEHFVENLLIGYDALREKFRDFPWRRSKKQIEAWTEGRTGHPVVDTAMRQLWRIGWMHKRVRMVVASFLTKDLLVPWQEGARWFWDTLVDADLALEAYGKVR